MTTQSESEVLVSCQGVSKKFCKNLKRSLWDGVKDSVSEIVRGESSDSLRKDEFWALNDVSFKLNRGECMGLVGRNGAGKTTLLKVLSGLIIPDKGTVTLKGKIGGLIALGAGFNGILSGRENIRINGAILGYSRDEVEERMQEIIDFAEIPDFIDAPVNTYSSGMSVRLGFAIAAILTKPDVLLLDEVLAVGDIGFTIKCLNAVREMMKDSAVIFVSHNMQFISKFCSQVILFENGNIISRNNDVPSGISSYLSLFSHKYTNLNSKKFKLENFALINHKGDKITKCTDDQFLKVNQGKKLSITFDLITKERDSGLNIYLYIMDLQSTPIVCYRGINVNKLEKDFNLVSFDLGIIDLNSGRYSFTVALVDSTKEICDVRMEGLLPFIVENPTYSWGFISRKALGTIN